MLSHWLKSRHRKPTPYRKFDLIDIEEKPPISQEVKSHLTRLLLESRFDLTFVRSAARRMGWKNVEESLVAAGLPKTPKIKRGVFGEVLTNALLTEFFGYKIPVKKLRFTITPDRSLPGTDTIAIKTSGDGFAEICYIESKLRTTGDHYACRAAIDGYEQLREDYLEKIPDMILFVLTRLHARKDPLFLHFLNYLNSRKDMTHIERLRLGLTWELDEWKERVLELLEEEDIEPDLPKLVVQCVRVQGIVKLSDEIFRKAGMGEVIDE